MTINTISTTESKIRYKRRSKKKKNYEPILKKRRVYLTNLKLRVEYIIFKPTLL